MGSSNPAWRGLGHLVYVGIPDTKNIMQPRAHKATAGPTKKENNVAAVMPIVYINQDLENIDTK